MKLKLLFLAAIFSFTNSKGQSKPFQDSLAQFSYLLYGSTTLNKKYPATKVAGRQGTGFFIEDNKRIYFITARHAVVNFLEKNNKRSDFPENYNVYSHYSDKFNFIPVSAIWISNISQVKEGLKDADVFAYDVTDKLNRFPVSTIKISHTDIISSKDQFSEIRIFGFPENMNKIENGIIQIAPPYLFSTKNFSIAENFINQIGNERGIDSLRYEVIIKDARITRAFGGFSGAPVFIHQVRENNWQFLGILVAINTIRNSIYLVKKEKLLIIYNLFPTTTFNFN